MTVPKSVEKIGEYAFGLRYAPYLGEDIVIPGFTIKCYKDSAALEYAGNYGIKYTIIKED